MTNTQQTLRCQLTALADFACSQSAGLSIAELRAIANHIHLSAQRIEAEASRRAGHSGLSGVFG